jgi:nicotinamide-nucleotide amidase
MFPAELNESAATLIALCRASGIRLATAESCTGGLVAGLLTEIPGASAVVERGFVVYSNEAKQELLGVPVATIDAFGAVSEPTARAMAQGALAHSHADLAVAITGIAGPGGGAPGKPVGLVHFACAAADGSIVALEKRYGALSRAAIRLASVATALELLASAVSRRAGQADGRP